MILRQTPKNINNYIMVDSEISNKLHQKGFYPKYIDNNGIYYLKTKEIIDYIRKEDLKCKNI